MVSKAKVGRPKKEGTKKLIKFPDPVLAMIPGNLTEFVNEAVLEKLVRMKVARKDQK
jgi:hypothetical protein